MATIKNITYRPVAQNEKATHGVYKHLIERFEGLTIGTAKNWVSEMSEHPEFKAFVEHPTHKIVLVNYQGFALYIKWKTRNRFKAKKETLREMLKNIEIERKLLEEVADMDFSDLMA